MKTKLFLLLTAAMLLLSVNVSAQKMNKKADTTVTTEKTVKKAAPKKAESTTPLKGDVNGDGKVDVADIAAVIGIMKNSGGIGGETNNYFLGAVPIEKVTFTTADLNEYKATKPSSITVHISDGDNYLAVWIFPASWGKPTFKYNMNRSWHFNDGELEAPEGYNIAYTNIYSDTTYDLEW